MGVLDRDRAVDVDDSRVVPLRTDGGEPGCSSHGWLIRSTHRSGSLLDSLEDADSELGAGVGVGVNTEADGGRERLLDESGEFLNDHCVSTGLHNR